LVPIFPSLGCPRFLANENRVLSRLAYFLFTKPNQIGMNAQLNCTRLLDERHAQQWNLTQTLIETEHEELRTLFPDLSRVELHLRAFSQQAEAHLLMQDDASQSVEAHAHGESLEGAVSLAFQRARAHLREVLPS
jgi:hypothetical protein